VQQEGERRDAELTRQAKKSKSNGDGRMAPNFATGGLPRRGFY
jgi:hypothetical protein